MSIEISQSNPPNRIPLSSASSSIDIHKLRAVENSSISWRLIFAGTFISLLTYLILVSLGLALGSSSLKNLIQGSANGGSLGIGTAIWLVVTTLISLYIGSYTASRASGLISSRVGKIQGAVITALFFTVFLSQVGSTISLLGKSIGSTVGALGGAAGDLTKNPQIQQTIRNALKGLNLKSPPDVVVQGLATRLLRGDQTGARDYLASQAGMTPAAADQRIQGFTRDLQNTLKEVGGTTADVISKAGWTLFGALLLGTLSGVLGGGAGAEANLSRPSNKSDRAALKGSKVA